MANVEIIKADRTTDTWDQMIAKMFDSNKRCEIDEEMFYYFMETLPPIYMGREIEIDGERILTAYGFAEGADYITAFWVEGTKENPVYMCQKTNEMNPYA